VLASYSLVSMYGLFLSADRRGLLVLDLRVGLGGLKEWLTSDSSGVLPS
jgi:hypothetical protein